MLTVVIKFFLYLFALFPLRLNHFIGRLLGLALYYMRNTSCRTSRINIQTCFPELTPDEQEVLLKKSLIEMGKSITELGPIWLWNKSRTMTLLKEVSGKEVMEEAHKAGKGIILITPHLGCWEMAGLYLGCELPVTILYRPPRLASLDSMMRKARKKTGAQLATTDISGIKVILKELKKGHATGLLPDQNPEEDNSWVYAPFFGIPVKTMSLISKLSCKTKASIVIGYAERLPQGQGYHLHLYKADDAIANPDPVISTAALNKAIECFIREKPEQYQWSYKRFKRLPKEYGKIY